MKELIIILFVFAIVACREKIMKETTSIKGFDKQYYFGFEEKAVIDSNLTIPDSIRIHYDAPPWSILERSFVSDSTMCFKSDNTTYIKAQHDLQYDTQEFKSDYFLVILNNNNNFEYKFRYLENPDCVTCFPVKTLIGKRLILDKSEYKINDTVKGKILLKYYVDSECADSANRFKISVDSISFKYKLYQGSTNLINQFEKDYKEVKWRER